MTGEKREEGVKPCVLSEGVMCVSGCIADLVITDLTWRIKTQRSAEREKQSDVRVYGTVT